MGYCERNIKGGCFHELSKGDYERNEQYWREDSLFLDDDVFQDLGLYHLFARVIPQYDTWGLNKISQAQWEQIKAEAAEFGTRVQEFLQEVEPWVQENFQTETCFFILGV